MPKEECWGRGDGAEGGSVLSSEGTSTLLEIWLALKNTFVIRECKRPKSWKGSWAVRIQGMEVSLGGLHLRRLGHLGLGLRVRWGKGFGKVDWGWTKSMSAGRGLDRPRCKVGYTQCGELGRMSGLLGALWDWTQPLPPSLSPSSLCCSSSCCSVEGRNQLKVMQQSGSWRQRLGCRTGFRSPAQGACWHNNPESVTLFLSENSYV